MARRQPLTVRQRRLAAEMLALRGPIPREKVFADTGVSEGALLKMEKARTRPQKRTMITLLDYYGASAEKRAELIDLWQNANRMSELQPIEDSLPESYQTLLGFEAEASSLSAVEGHFVPGLLQTEDYAHAVMRSLLPEESDEGIRQRVMIRMRRQEALSRRNAVRLWAILDEAVIRRQVGGEQVMQAQLARLAEVSRAANTITVQILPASAGAHPGMLGAFLIMDFDEPDPPLVYTETLSGGLFQESEDNVDRYRHTFQRLTAQALSVAETLQMIETAASAG